MSMTSTSLRILCAGLIVNDLSFQRPYNLFGFSDWSSICGCISGVSDVFISNEGLIKQLRAPLSVHVYRLVWRQILFFAHNLIVYAVMLLIYPQSLGWASLTVVPAVLLLAVNGAWVALLFGIVTTRFRD